MKKIFSQALPSFFSKSFLAVSAPFCGSIGLRFLMLAVLVTAPSFGQANQCKQAIAQLKEDGLPRKCLRGTDVCQKNAQTILRDLKENYVDFDMAKAEVMVVVGLGSSWKYHTFVVYDGEVLDFEMEELNVVKPVSIEKFAKTFSWNGRTRYITFPGDEYLESEIPEPIWDQMPRKRVSEKINFDQELWLNFSDWVTEQTGRDDLAPRWYSIFRR